MMFRRKARDPEVEQQRLDLHGTYGPVQVQLEGVPVSVRQSGQRRLVDPDATIAWIDAVEKDLELVERKRKSTSCTRCGGPLAGTPTAYGPVTFDTPAQTAGTLTLQAQVTACGVCGVGHVDSSEQLFSDVMDAMIDALDRAEVKR